VTVPITRDKIETTVQKKKKRVGNSTSDAKHLKIISGEKKTKAQFPFTKRTRNRRRFKK